MMYKTLDAVKDAHPEYPAFMSWQDFLKDPFCNFHSPKAVYQNGKGFAVGDIFSVGALSGGIMVQVQVGKKIVSHSAEKTTDKDPVIVLAKAYLTVANGQ